MNKIKLLSIFMVSIYFLAFMVPVSGLEYSTGTLFTIEIETRLTGTSGDYSGYTETEEDFRAYSITSANENQVYFNYLSDYTYRDNDGGSYDAATENKFTIDPSDNSYIGGGDGDDEYYTFDNIWFRIDPSSKQGDSIHILGFDYEVESIETVEIGKFEAVEAFKVVLAEPGIYTVDNLEYDPDGELEVSFTDTIYFDTLSGYVVKEEWNAVGKTSVGNFEWKETSILIEHSFEVAIDTIAIVLNSSVEIISIIGIIVIIILYPKYRKKRWREEVDNSIAILSNQDFKMPVIPSDAPTIWDPLKIDFKNIIGEINVGVQKVTLADGVYIVIDTNNRLVIGDVNSDRYLPSHIMQLKEDNMRLLYRLALGLIEYNSEEHNYLGQQHADLIPYLQPSKGYAAPDNIALQLFFVSQTKDPEYREVAHLVARRKVLDYSHGQAPLTPDAHLRKYRKVLEFNPHNVLLVGDDDLISVSLARKGVKVTLVEIDPYTCALIDGLAQMENLPITIHQVDLRDPLPEDIPDNFDLFVADPDFTIPAFALFASRGLSKLRVGGTGLINFENKGGQKFKAEYFLEKINAEIIDSDTEPWSYVIIRNQQISRGSYYGKYTYVDYEDDLVLSHAAYSSVMFVIKRGPTTEVPLLSHHRLEGPAKSIYDF